MLHVPLSKLVFFATFPAATKDDNPNNQDTCDDSSNYNSSGCNIHTVWGKGRKEKVFAHYTCSKAKITIYTVFAVSLVILNFNFVLQTTFIWRYLNEHNGFYVVRLNSLEILVVVK